MTLNVTHRNSLMSGRGRHLFVLSPADKEVVVPSTWFSFCPRLENQSTWSRSMIAPRRFRSRFL